ncbi:MAG: hypothetical protein KY455_01630 [Euryarchaeota archaeon]|nr:hypothetical protein [Euryarchaeota archaeon]
MRPFLVASLFAVSLLAGCIGDEPSIPTTDEDLSYTVFALPETISGIEAVTSVGTEGGGTGIWFDEDRHLAISANGGAGLHIIDVSDPLNASVIGRLGEIYARDADFLEYNGTKYALLAGGREGIHVIDITDPTEPVLVFTAEDHPSHNVAAVPGTPYVYNAQPFVRDILVPNTPSGVPNVGPTPLDTDRGSTILDISQGTNGTWTEIPFPADWDGVRLTSNGCHDVVVRTDLDRAYCAGGGYEYREGGGETFIWDIADDPRKPKFIGMVDNPFIVYHHQAIVSEDGTILYINDEHIFPNCNRADAGPLSVQQPTAAMWVYDISDPADPEMLSWLQPADPNGPVPEPNGNCGSHFGDIIDGTSFLVWGWYQGGTLLIDVSDPTMPEIVQQVVPKSSVWDARYFNGHVYGSDDDLSVFRVV